MNEEIVVTGTEQEFQITLAQQYVNEISALRDNLQGNIANTEKLVKKLRDELNNAQFHLQVQKANQNLVASIEERLDILNKNYDRSQLGQNLQPVSRTEGKSGTH